MAKLIRCEDVLGCEDVMYGRTEDEVIAKAEDHVRALHNMTIIPPDVVQKIVDNVKDGEAPPRKWWSWRRGAA